MTVEDVPKPYLRINYCIILLTEEYENHVLNRMKVYLKLMNEMSHDERLHHIKHLYYLFTVHGTTLILKPKPLVVSFLMRFKPEK